MTLEPLASSPVPAYPARLPALRRLAARARRLGLAASASLALTLGGGCYGAVPIERWAPDGGGDGSVDGGTGGDAGDGGVDAGGGTSDSGLDAEVAPADADLSPLPVVWCEPDFRLSGEAMPPTTYFACGEGPEAALVHTGPQWLMSGELCDRGSAWARVELSEAIRAAVSFPYGTETVALRLLAPDGSLAVELGPEAPCAELETQAGPWTLEAYPAGVGPTEGTFTVAFDQVYER